MSFAPLGLRYHPTSNSMTSPSPVHHGKLNVFQRLMLQWSELHPYNAVHVYKIARCLAPETFRESLRATCQAEGLGIVRLAPDGKTFCHLVDEWPEVTVLSDAIASDTILSQVISAELNRSFQRPAGKPWHFTLVDAGATSHYVVLTYDHWVADSTSARMFARHVLDRYLQWNLEEDQPFLNLNPDTYRKTFPQQTALANLVRTAAHSLRQLQHDRRAAQLTYSLSHHGEVGFDLYRTAPQSVDRLRHYARNLGATVHDVILAALGLAIARVLPRRPLRPQPPLTLGTIVDVRGESSHNLDHTLGLYLGNYLVRLAGDAKMSLADATRYVAAATAPAKARRAYFDSLVSMKAASAAWAMLSMRWKRHFYPTFMPLTAGISNVVAREAWLTEATEITEYFRGASTGPMTPLVLSPTTLNGAMNLGVTYRLAGFSQQKLSSLMAQLLEMLEDPVGNRSPRLDRKGRQTGSRRVEIERQVVTAIAG